MNYRNKADATTHQTRKPEIRFCYHALSAAALLALFVIGCAAGSPSTPLTGLPNGSGEPLDRPVREAIEAKPSDVVGGDTRTSEEGDSSLSLPLAGDGEPVSVPTFPTFSSTGVEICTNEKGLPLIYLFSSSLCSHCEWGGGAYDFIVRFLAADGLIEAHHYDLLTGDDLLTEEIETKVPADELELYHRENPKDLVPYYNFGCAYDRIGNGYERENDLVAEGEEMRRVIEALVRMVSKDE